MGCIQFGKKKLEIEVVKNGEIVNDKSKKIINKKKNKEKKEKSSTNNNNNNQQGEGKNSSIKTGPNSAKVRPLTPLTIITRK